MANNFLLELGTEEIPAGPLAGAIEALGPSMTRALSTHRLSYQGDLKVVGTPRRLTVFVGDLVDSQPDLAERVVGPPARVAFDSSGAPTKAAEGFARKNGVMISSLRRESIEGRSGEYVVCSRTEEGRQTEELLGEIVTSVVTTLAWPKSMRWGDGRHFAFVRPIQWLVCLFGENIIDLTLAGVKSSDRSRGHRFLHPDPFVVSADFDNYSQALKERFVIVDPAARRQLITCELRRLEREANAVVRQDDELVAEVANLLEYPVGIVGNFDPNYLEVPAPIIVSAMRGHQRYFAMEDSEGNLSNQFATIAGTVTRDKQVVARGNERVLAARLADAKFFFDEDQKTSLDDFGVRLNGVVFHKKLGTVGAKVNRIANLASRFAAHLNIDEALAKRAALLCKADLVSKAVYEFPDLQGVMGRHYAIAAGEHPDVAIAIEEHYLPRGANDELPKTDLGALVGLADRIDTVVGGFAVGLAPSGSADQFGLRRAGLGILHILLSRGWDLSLSHLIDAAATELEGMTEIPDSLRQEISEFFRVRLLGLLADHPRDCVEAALAAGYTVVPDAKARAQAVANLRTRADFEPLATAFKRVANILKGTSSASEPLVERFVSDDERLLWTTFSDIRGRISEHLSDGDYESALVVLAELKAPVDRFFTNVLVNVDDLEIRDNRLALLSSINATFTRIADFRQLAV